MTIVKDCFDDPTVNVSVSPRELKLMLMAMNAFQEQLRTGSYSINEESHERWEELLDHVKDQALAHSV
jgi:hypothetical protein